MIGLAVLGATGSIGRSTLDVAARHPDRFRVVALAGARDVEGMRALCGRFRPAVVAMAEPAAARRLAQGLREEGLGIEVLAGAEGVEAVAALPEAAFVMAAIVGAAGLRPALAAARAGKRVLLANKESLVMAGALFMEAVREGGAELVPIDSEHNAVFQCLPPGSRPGQAPAGVRRIILTASGGPFRDAPLERLAAVTPEEACAHPNWSMGRKISVDSATMMNKGLEVMEACWLFGLPAERVEVVLHPQSIVHSLVEYVDGSVLAQLGNPDMRTPIAQALGWPERIEAGVEALDLVRAGRLDFRAPDPGRYPCLGLAYAAQRAGGTAPAILNAANEVAVAAFLGGRLPFTAIAEVIEDTLAAVPAGPADSLEAVLEADRRAREHAARRAAA
ncbi:1-deoxy-D-xylulose-5-phosphate reductoisomerase [Inmirania thermothiophila]|uniref:1-deoxy-D-xylulose 5-phosphate reductoisomerase n=1 Tax=Inmirania thermothiophila TaxID=1750597 RepID=A0A3N1Y075_9GAMM|nr:1-deoxy-D-xylulose-5-phosphate reductoisomerase [Inmirania thermothiophila]ROR32220.1 1-deoxy-D-xylulose 5-phosphate reductoisomerase [Inmirania thermothiophila]